MVNFLKLPSELDSSIKKNFALNLLDGGIFSFGMSFVSINTVLPVFVKNYGGSNIEIGLIPVLWIIGFHLPQIFIANYAGNQPYKKKLILRTALIQRLAWLLVAFVSYLIVFGVSQEIVLILFFVALSIAALSGGFNLPAWFDLISKITPFNIRGKLFAYRVAMGSTLGIVGGALTKFILDNIEPPGSFTLLFLIGFGVMMSSYVMLMKLVEDKPNPPKERQNLYDFFNNLPTILNKETNYRNFLVSDALIIIAMIANAFFTVSAIQRFSLSEGYAGTFTVVLMVSLLIGSFIFGVLADKLGHRLNLFFAAVFGLLACMFAIIASSIEIYLLAFIASAFATAIIQVSRLPIIAEICGEKERTTYVSLTNVLTVPFVLSGVVAGWLANMYGYNIVFYITGSAALIAAFWVVLNVKEPRTVIEENN